ncbi:glutamic acid-rich protein-like [Cynara cardunculus var. scolymus]|uniref:glutamic acid-rich protein-like n=1 Tax=Cynara cardunculus var. scolymus TaxID=59895 RepID=UPI000D6300CB|nr:glutamic acid-rich protein-like [Cynara cardunculus var. scolymus]
MAEDVKLLPTVATVLDKMDEVHQPMPMKEDLTHNLSVVKVEVFEVNKLLKMVQNEVCTSTEAINALNSKANEVQAQLTKHVEALSNLEQSTEEISLRLNDITSSLADDKEGEKDQRKKIVVEIVDEAVVAAEVEQLALIAKSDDAITSNEAEAVVDIEDDDVMILSFLTLDSLRDDDDDDDDDDEYDNNENDDNDEFTIQYHPRPASAQKGVSLRESASQGEKPQGTSPPLVKIKKWLKKEI